MQRDTLRITTDKSKWNSKKCLSNLQEGKKRTNKPEKQKQRENKNKMEIIKSVQELSGCTTVQTSTQMPGLLSHHYYLPVGPASPLSHSQACPWLQPSAIHH